MDEKTRKTVLIAYQERKQEEIQHPFIQEKVKIGLIPHLQAQLLTRPPPRRPRRLPGISLEVTPMRAKLERSIPHDDTRHL